MGSRLGFQFRCFVAFIFTIFITWINSSSFFVVNLFFPLFSNARNELVLTVDIILSWRVWPHRVFIGCFCFGSSGVTLEWFVRLNPERFTWTDTPSNYCFVNFGTALDVGLRDFPVVQSTPTTNWAHEHHPVVESNVVC